MQVQTIYRVLYKTQVTVTWESFRFCYELQSLELEEVLAALKAAVAKNTSQMHKYPLEPDKGFLIRLSRKELECFGEEAAQVACQSAILVGSKDYYYKCQFLAFPPHLLHILCHN